MGTRIVSSELLKNSGFLHKRGVMIRMKAIKWLDKHFEEAILIFCLAVIACVELMQVVARNVPFIPALTWAEELCRFVWIATVFLSLPYTIRTESMLRVTALIDILPWKTRNVLNIFVDVFTFIMMAVLSYNAVIVLQRIIASGETSPAMLLPMWIMYAIVLAGFVLGAARSVQMGIIHAKHFNEPSMSAVEEQAELELAQGGVEVDAVHAETSHEKGGA